MADQQSSVQDQTFDDTQSQQSYDQDFSALSSSIPGGVDTVRPVVDAYFEEAERSLETTRQHTQHTLRTARRVSDLWALSLMQQQITNVAARQAIPQVIQYIKTHPEQFKEMIDKASRR